MTRFARSKGSTGSGSNPRRVEEDATPWQQMAQAVRSQNHVKENFEEIEDEDEEEHSKENHVSKGNISNSNITDVEEDDDNEDFVADILAESDEEEKEEEKEEKEKPQKKSRRERTKDKCLNCKEKGHQKKECPELPEERRKELQELYEMKVTRKGQGTGRKKNKKRKATETKQEEEQAPKEKRSKMVKDKTGQVVGKDEGLYQGFRVRLKDVSRLKALEKSLRMDKSMSPSQTADTLKRERRKAERELAKYNKMVCYNCRESGHLLADCPKGHQGEEQPKANAKCFKCGSQDHTSKDCQAKTKPGAMSYAFATCFICKEVGHLAKACPDNPKGLYPKGGGCRFCGSVEHLKADCPRKSQKDSKLEVKVGTISSGKGVEDIDEDHIKVKKAKQDPKLMKKVVNF